MPRLRTLGSRVAMAPSPATKVVTPGSWRSGLNSTQRGYGYRWQKARDSYLAQHPLCVMCQAEGRVAVATVVDHVVPHRGDQSIFWDVDNWQALCAEHHDGAKARAERAAGLR